MIIPIFNSLHPLTRKNLTLIPTYEFVKHTCACEDTFKSIRFLSTPIFLSLSLSLSPPPLPFVSILLTPIVVFVTKMVYSQVNQYKNVVSSTPLVVPQLQVVAWPQHRHSNIDVVHLSLLYIMQLGGKIRMLLPSSMLMIWYHDLCVLFCCCCFCCCDIHIYI